MAKDNKKRTRTGIIHTTCLLCGVIPTDECHIKTRGSGGTDDDWNLVYLCRRHHREQEDSTHTEFAKKYPLFKKALEQKGWILCETRKKYYRPLEVVK